MTKKKQPPGYRNRQDYGVICCNCYLAECVEFWAQPNGPLAMEYCPIEVARRFGLPPATVANISKETLETHGFNMRWAFVGAVRAVAA